jgi:hypothetical protein
MRTMLAFRFSRSTDSEGSSTANLLIQALLCLSISAPFSLAAAQATSDSVLAPKWRSYCDPYRPGTPTLEISWPISRRPVPSPVLAKRIEAQQLLVTAYRDGFDTGRFVTVTNVASSIAALSFDGGRANSTPLPPLAGLRIVDFATSTQGPQHQMQLQSQVWRLTNSAAKAVGLSKPTTLNSVTVKLAGMLPGVRYTVRIPSSPDTAYDRAADVRITTPTCPADQSTRDSEKTPK